MSSGSGVVSYETYAPRSTTQIARLNRIDQLTAGPTARAAAAAASSIDHHGDGPSLFFSQAMSVPSLYHEDSVVVGNSSSSSNQESKETEPTATVSNMQSSPVVQEAVSRASEVSQALTHQWKHTTSLRLACRASLNIAQDISAAHVALIRHSGELSAAADRLQEQATALEQHAAEIGQPLQHYNAVDRIGIQVGVLFKTGTSRQQQSHVRGLAKIKVDDDEFPKVLQEIDDAILYFGKESGGSQALQELQKTQSRQSRQQQQQTPVSGNLEYYRRALVLQEAALFLIQEAVADRIQTTTQQISNALPSTQIVPADQLEASLIYTRFHGISNRSNRLLTLVKSRLHSLQSHRYALGGEEALTAYYELVQKCRTTYCNSRETLLRPTLRAHMEQLHKLHGPTGMTRLASVFWIRLCTVETNLYVDFFGDAQPHKTTELQICLASLCTATLHRTVRRSLVSLTDLDTLCQIVSVLREEGVQASQQTTAAAAAKALVHLTEDAQERLIFCANRHLQREVIRFKATPKDLDYPNKLLELKKKQKQATEPANQESEAKEASSGPNDSLQDVQEQLNWVYESWFPPMRTVLRILSKIFRVVEPRVFEDLALHSVQACTGALKDGAQFIRTAKSQRDAHLFLVQHLLILREQVSPFDLELRTVERQLDFSEAGKAMAKFLANRNRRLLSMNTENAIVTLLREGVSVQESNVDSKRDLEDALRNACNDFIAHALQSLAGKLVNFVQERSDSTGEGGDKKKSQQKIKESPEVVTQMLQETVDSIQKEMPALWEQMTLYLDNPSTQSILFKPVTKKIIKAVEELKQWMHNTVDHQWNSEARSHALEVANKVEPFHLQTRTATATPGDTTPTKPIPPTASVATTVATAENPET